jgi:hypothetical protein
VAVSLLKPPPSQGGLRSETAVTYVTVSGVRRLPVKIHSGYNIWDGHPPAGKSARSGVTVI